MLSNTRISQLSRFSTYYTNICTAKLKRLYSGRLLASISKVWSRRGSLTNSPGRCFQLSTLEANQPFPHRRILLCLEELAGECQTERHSTQSENNQSTRKRRVFLSDKSVEMSTRWRTNTVLILMLLLSSHVTMTISEL